MSTVDCMQIQFYLKQTSDAGFDAPCNPILRRSSPLLHADVYPPMWSYFEAANGSVQLSRQAASSFFRRNPPHSTAVIECAPVWNYTMLDSRYRLTSHHPPLRPSGSLRHVYQISLKMKTEPCISGMSKPVFLSL